jgi:hypothetical protein
LTTPTPTPLPELAEKLPAGTFALQVSNFRFVTFEQKNRPPSRKLRFSCIFQVDHPTLGPLAFGWDGCLAHRGKDPETGVDTVVWGPPATRSGFRYLKTSWVNRAVYDAVLDAICSSEYVALMGTNQESTAVDPRDIDPSLPALLNAL